MEIYSDQEIARLLAEPKMLPPDLASRIVLKPKRGHKERELELRGEDGSQFQLRFRQSLINALDFSVILAYCPPQSNQVFRLRRYNGKSHEHTNQVEGNTFYDFHIHAATQRYQELGEREDGYAQPTDRYADYQDAFRCLVGDCGFKLPANAQLRFFWEV